MSRRVAWRNFRRFGLTTPISNKHLCQVISKVTQDAENGESLAVASEPEAKRLSRAEFQGLGEMPPELEWFANLNNPRTRRAYRLDVRDFTAFAGVERPY
jgi:DNA gyrase/topoisomerase IV subunit B